MITSLDFKSTFHQPGADTILNGHNGKLWVGFLYLVELENFYLAICELSAHCGKLKIA